MGDEASYWQSTWADANSERRGFMAASAAAAQGESVFQQFHEALMRLVHEEHQELGDEQTLLDAAAAAGLDIEQFRADWHNRHLGLQALTSHNEGREMYRVFGTPTLLFPDGQAIHLELNGVPVLTQAVTLWQTIMTLAQSQRVIQQIKRTTPV
jgi:predicted DsbA family dithiol-disulfide isomerase